MRKRFSERSPRYSHLENPNARKPRSRTRRLRGKATSPRRLKSPSNASHRLIEPAHHQRSLNAQHRVTGPNEPLLTRCIRRDACCVIRIPIDLDDERPSRREEIHDRRAKNDLPAKDDPEAPTPKPRPKERLRWRGVKPHVVSTLLEKHLTRETKREKFLRLNERRR